MLAKIICRSTLLSQLEELNDDMSNLVKNGFEPVKMTQTTEDGVSKVCILLTKTGMGL